MKRGFLFIVILIMCKFSGAQSPGITWQKSLGGSAADEAKCVQPTPDGGYIVGGTSSSNDGDVTGNHGGKDCWVVKLDAAGSIEWQKTYGGTGDETFGSIRKTADGGYIMGATTTSNNGDVSGSHGYGEAWVVKLNSAGTIQWQKCFGSSGGDFLEYVEETFDGGYICMGKCGINDGDLAGQLPELGGGWIFKLDSLRTIQWQKANFDGGDIAGGVVYYSITQTTDTGFVYCGFSRGISGSVFIYKMNNSGFGMGGDIWSPELSGFYEVAGPRSLTPTADGGCVTVYKNDGPLGPNDLFLAPVIRKYNSAMVPEWTRKLNTFGDAVNITKTTDGGYLLTGKNNGATGSGDMPGAQGGYDYWLAKLNSTGGLQWQRMLGSTHNDLPWWSESATDSSYIVVGRTDTTSGDVTGNHGGNDFWVVKLPYSSPSFAIISSAGTNGTISPNGGLIYPLGINQVFTITPNTGYRISSVLIDGVSDTAAISRGSYTFSNVNASHTISVTFAVKTYSITATSGGNGLVTPLGGSTVNHGSSKTYTITPATGYNILDILVDGIPVNPRTSYTFSNITANHTIRALFARPDSVLYYVCPAGDSAIITSNISGTNYRWQLNSGNGNGYVNLNDGQGLYFGGTSTATLTIKNYTPAVFGYKYRCVVDEASSLINVLRFKNIWTGTFDTHWEIPQNWSCGRLPDSNTDVEILAGANLIISTNITIRSLVSGPGANITIAPGGNLTILH